MLKEKDKKHHREEKKYSPPLDLDLNKSGLKHQFWGPPWKGRFVVQKDFMIHHQIQKGVKGKIGLACWEHEPAF